MSKKITEEIPQLAQENVPVEGQPSSVFRHNAGLAWAWLKDLAESLSRMISQINEVKTEIDSHAENVQTNKEYVQESRTVVEETMAKMPEGTINDTTASSTDTYSSQKINEIIKSHKDNKSNPHGVTAAQVGAYSKEETLSKEEIETNISNIVTFPIGYPMLSYEAYDFTVVGFGGEFNRADYPKLWAWIEAHPEFLLSEADWQTKNTTDGMCAYYSSGDEVDTFRVPNLNEAFFRASNRGVGTYQADEFKSHQHMQTGVNGQSPFGLGDSIYGSGWHATLTSEARLTSATGGTETRPKNIALLPLIVAA